MAKLFVGNRSLSIADVYDASTGAFQIVCDESSLAKLPRAAAAAPPAATAASGGGGGGAARAPAASTPLSPLPSCMDASACPAPRAFGRSETRAILFCTVNHILLGRSGVRGEVVEWLVAALNEDARAGGAATPSALPLLYDTHVLPAAAAAAAPAMRQLCSALQQGSGAPGLLPGDLVGLLSLGASAPAALGALALHGAGALCALADAVAAVTWEEAACPSAGPLDGELLEASRPLPGLAGSALALRLLLEGGLPTRERPLEAAGAAPGENFLQHRLVPTPQFHAAAAATLAASARALTVELNSALPVVPLPRAGGGKVHLDTLAAVLVGAGSSGGGALLSSQVAGSRHCAPLCAALGAAQRAVEDLVWASAQRCPTAAVAGAGAGAATAPAASPPPTTPAACCGQTPEASSSAALCAAECLQCAVNRLLQCLRAEYDAGNGALSVREAAAAAAAGAREKAKAEAAAAREASEAARVAAMGAEERAKWEEEQAKRREKAAKRAEKEGREGGGEAAGGEAAAGGGGGSGAGAAAPALKNVLGLGVGVQEFREFLRSASGGEGSAALSPYFAPAPGAAAAAAEPAAAFLRRLLDRLGSGGHKRKPKIAKGTRDYASEQMEVRERAFNTIRAVFKRHGAVELDTPVFEQRETLLGKYGEEGGKLIYDLADQGGELLSLRYDLTVPFARYLAMNGLENMKRYHISRVYRRDNPQLAKGRYREFYQCDFDIAGTYGPMLPDAEVLKVCTEILAALPIGEFTIKLNHRKLLDACLALAGIPAAKFRTVCSSIDKLDKEPWAAVREELIGEKGVAAAAADAVGVLVQRSGAPLELLAALEAEGVFAGQAGGRAALADLTLLFKYLQAMGALRYLTLDLSLARGLDYYTGLIYEAVLLDPSVGVGSIAAGGRYDGLVGMFSATGAAVPCVGVSIGVERVFTIMEAAAVAASGGLKRTPVQVWVASIPSSRGKDMALERMRLLGELWDGGYSAEGVQGGGDPKLQKQLSAANDAGCPFVLVLGEDELDAGTVQLKDLASKESFTLERGELLAQLAARGAQKLRMGLTV